MTTAITKWYLIPEALALLADCAKDEPTHLRYTSQSIRNREEWFAYDPDDSRVDRLTAIRGEVLNPLLADKERYRLADAAGLMVKVDTVIDAVCREPYCARFIHEIEQVRDVAAQIAAAMDQSIGGMAA